MPRLDLGLALRERSTLDEFEPDRVRFRWIDVGRDGDGEAGAGREVERYDEGRDRDGEPAIVEVLDSEVGIGATSGTVSGVTPVGLAVNTGGVETSTASEDGPAVVSEGFMSPGVVSTVGAPRRCRRLQTYRQLEFHYLKTA